MYASIISALNTLVSHISTAVLQMWTERSYLSYYKNVHNTILATLHISIDNHLVGVGFVNFQTGPLDSSLDVERTKSTRSSWP